MSNFDITATDFSSEIRMLESTDPNSNVIFNVLIQKLINNEAFLKRLISELENKITQLEGCKVNRHTGYVTPFEIGYNNQYPHALYVFNKQSRKLYYANMVENQ